MSATSVREGGPTLKGPFDFPSSPLSKASRQPLLLGLFLNLQDIKISTHPTSNTWTFDYNLDLVRKAEALGFELAFSRTQWLPKGGYDGEASLDAFVALGAMAAVTRSILLISTMHVLYSPLHPLHIAKYGATLDHVAKGRWGINVVTGHRAVEHEMFGRQRIEHDKRLWGETENLSYKGRVSPWQLENAWITPKPEFGRPILINATGSPAGIEFAAQYSDLIFITSPGTANIESALETLPAHIATIRKVVKSKGRAVKILINPIIVSRDTPEEAWAYARSIAEGTKVQTGTKKFGTANGNYGSDAHAWRGRKGEQEKQGLNIGGNIEIIGSPEQVVEQLEALHKIGIDGVVANFYDFAPDLDYFGQKILPLVKKAGLRVDYIDQASPTSSPLLFHPLSEMPITQQSFCEEGRFYKDKESDRPLISQPLDQDYLQ
ncbi:FMNH(2)-dependent dimethylsulfone monooxygenase [Colletotrichum fructicola Nara gc5]|uniref:FMNH(2)-dependent dimethylsulfone monooxygenase n=1 Tax=Colletotrichum fructicola (strain Nara gc5) TaxID=1213859 RepID=L2GHE8_COLFN|nr:FMNH(2)-dependent dimethylsulfone monooxygenase [Colletotrichum fructicola Nara gc5]KAF4883538.1 FMNH(2)-dependent dimethylsulfone monooxygenase [Colletotrichum fructicola]